MVMQHLRSPHYRTTRTVLSVAIATALASGYARAEVSSETGGQGADQKQASPAKAADAKNELAAQSTTVVVTGNRASLFQALNLKKDDDHIVEVISADNLGVMPNVSVAESLVRLPGVNGLRDRGNESLVSVRGLGQRLTLGLVNGREIASSEPGRSVRWEVFPTEVVSTAKVYKSQSADLVEGGIGGTIDIGTIDPLGYTGKSIVLTGGPVYYTEGKDVPHFNTLGQRLGATVVHKFNKDLAVAFGATYQKQKNGFSEMGSEGYNTTQAGDVTGGKGATPSPWGGSAAFEKMQQERKGALAVLQWRSGDFKVKADALYSNIDINQRKFENKFNGWSVGNWAGGNPYAAPGASYMMADGDVVGGSLPNSNLELDKTIGHWYEGKVLNAYGINAKWSADKWSFGADLSASSARRDGNWEGVWFKTFPKDVSYNFLGKPTISASPATLYGDSKSMGASDWGPDTVRDNVSAIALNAKRDIEGSAFTSIEFGVRAGNREKQHRHWEWNQPIISKSMADYKGLLYEFSMPNFNMPSLLGGDYEAVHKAAIGAWNPALATEGLLDKWNVKEKVRSAFTKATYDTTMLGLNVTGNVGLRVVRTTTSSRGYDGVGGGWYYDDAAGGWREHPYVYTPSSAEKTYTDVLPSATMNFALDDNRMLRLSLAKVVARPPLDELRTGRSLDLPTAGNNTYQLNGTGGNPQLDPFRATQLDVSYEWYFHKEALAAVSLFRKQVDSVIGYKQVHQTLNGLDYLIMAPANGNGGNINGAELAFKTPFYFIPHMQNFGINANYSLVQSNLHELAPTNNPLVLSGLARHTAEADLWFNNGTFDVGIGYKYHSPYTIVAGWSPSTLSRLKSEGIADLYAGWRINEQFRLKFSVSNLTNEPVRGYMDNQPNRLGNKQGSVGYQFYGRRLGLELTAAF